MSKVDRNAPRRSTASESRYTLFEFDRDFPDDAACLDYLAQELYPDGIYCPKCERITKHHREQSRPSYSCQFCGHREHPMVGTIFENSATSLRLWFYAMYLMASTRCGISAKQLERELGVTYKTAYRMFKQIRSLLAPDLESLNGAVEMDEVYIGGEAKWKNQGRPIGHGRGTVDKTPVFGMAQRKSGAKAKDGRIVGYVVPDATARTLLPHVETKVLPKSVVYTDEWKSYDGLDGMGYEHKRVQYSQKVYVSGDAHTNTIEGFWSLLQRGISGVYHGVSTKHLQSYLNEYTFRYNHRDAEGRGMFSAFLGRIEKASGPSEQPA
jgi:transposase